jgi:Na+-driven multidrug efflux pump
MYYTPTEQADVVYRLWQYLILVPIVTLLLAMALAMFARAIVTVFSSDGEIAEARVAAWVFVSASAAVWGAIWLGNDQPESPATDEVKTVAHGLRASR